MTFLASRAVIEQGIRVFACTAYTKEKEFLVCSDRYTKTLVKVKVVK
jgi:hypothetical protein